MSLLNSVSLLFNIPTLQITANLHLIQHVTGTQSRELTRPDCIQTTKPENLNVDRKGRDLENDGRNGLETAK